MKKNIFVILSVFIIFLRPALPADYHDNLRICQMVFPIYPIDSNYFENDPVDQLQEIIKNPWPSNRIFPLFLNNNFSGADRLDSLLTTYGLEDKIIRDPNATINSQIR